MVEIYEDLGAFRRLPYPRNRSIADPGVNAEMSTVHVLIPTTERPRRRHIPVGDPPDEQMTEG